MEREGKGVRQQCKVKALDKILDQLAIMRDVVAGGKWVGGLDVVDVTVDVRSHSMAA